ncbi:hypothetical protein AVEN_181774-1 [Araneus ventricosus]|uniref:Uncharacterized protein n=1 Tax=Araneus ventricosus TaxID=182803 RepID=A0A4Y2WJ77_ARAVE|nr:hypothetical protein AVEN_181774-1 [Araneus ventricosus]
MRLGYQPIDTPGTKMYHPSNGSPRTANTWGYIAVHEKQEANRAATASHGELPRLPSREGIGNEVELRLTFDACNETKLLSALEKMPATYLVPGTIQELEKLMQPKRATWSTITMVSFSLCACKIEAW